MKKLAFLALALMTLTACETIEENERWTDAKPIEMKKNVLVEDFTGQNCVNCPTAAAMLHTLMSTSMGEHIIAVSIHGGAMSLSCEKQVQGLATALGEEYNTHWGVTAWPSGMIDRKGGLKDYTSWTSAIAECGTQEPKISLGVNVSYNADSRKLEVKATSTENENGALSGSKLTVWLTESNITAMQMLPSGTRDMSYVHSHVLRDALTEAYGNDFGSKEWTKTYEIPMGYGKAASNEKYYCKPENMAVVAFVTDKNGDVLQVVDVPVVSK